MTGADMIISHSDDALVGIETIPSLFSLLVANISTLLFLPILMIAAFLALDVLGNKIRCKAYPVIAIAIALFSGFGLVFYSTTMGSVAVSYLALALVMTAVPAMLRFVTLTALDYAVMFACFSCIIRFIDLHSWLFGIALSALFVFVVILSICKIRLNRLNGQLFNAWFATVLTAMDGYIFDILFSRYVARIGYLFDTDAIKLFVWGMAILITIAFNIGLIYLIRRLFGKRFREIIDMGRAYPKIERYFIYNSMAILLLTTLLYIINKIMNTSNPIPDAAFHLFLLIAQAIQLSFLLLLFRITWLRDNLQEKVMESQALIDYSSSLEKNMDEIRAMKHDVKNIFIAMGHYVAQSGDSEMQDFFHTKISPFMSGEIAKNDLFGKLGFIHIEPLKTFLWYKISQAIGRGIVVDLDVPPRFPASGIPIELTDLVRILGILLDNAIEECLLLESGAITIKFAQNDSMDSYTVMNTVSAEKKETGIKVGVSSKGHGRGKGLEIARGLIGKYDCVTLNSYFKEDCFVQSFVVWKLDHQK